MINGTATLRGVTIGSGVYKLRNWPSGLLDTAPIRTSDMDRPGTDGMIAGPDLYGGLEIVFDGYVNAGSQAASESALAVLRNAFAPAATDQQLDVRVTGSPAEYTLFGRPRGCVAAMGREEFISGMIPVRCSFMATHPVRYGPTQSQQITIAAHTIPATLPFTLGLYGEQTITVTGTADVDRWTVTYVAPAGGPLINPRILHVAQNRLVQVDVSVPASNQLVLDGWTGKAVLGLVDQTIVPTSVSQWFPLNSGSNTLRFSAADGSHVSSTATIAWRGGWL